MEEAAQALLLELVAALEFHDEGGALALEEHIIMVAYRLDEALT